jgi:hypothetical protein
MSVRYHEREVRQGESEKAESGNLKLELKKWGEGGSSRKVIRLKATKAVGTAAVDHANA